MREIEGIESVVEKIRPPMAEIEIHFDAENEKFKRLLEADHDAIGRILKCHLIIERYLDSFLKAHYDIADLDGARLSFYQKAKLLSDAKSAAAFIKPGVLSINGIRNRFGHNLETEISEVDIGAIDTVLEVARRGVAFAGPLEKIEAFTTIACTFLVVPPPHMQQYFIDAFSEVTVNAP